MNWYAAHIVMVVRFKEQPQDQFPVWENIVLIEAKSDDEAFVKAEERGRQDEGDDDGSFRWGGKPATWVFVGVRKLTSCDDALQRPGNGTELTYLEMELSSEADLERFVRGEPTSVLIRDPFAEDAEV
jgi:hypothetical protein